MSTLVGIDKQVFLPPELGCSLYLPGLPGASNKIYDRSPYGNMGTITGATWKRTPGGLWVLSFDGTDDFADLGTTFSLGTGSYSLEAWIKASALSANMAILTSYDTNVAQVNGWYLFLLTTGKLSLRGSYRASPEAVWDGDGSSILSTNTWYHLVAIREIDADTLRLYINGIAESVTLSGTAPHNLNVDSPRPRVMGAARKDSGGINRSNFFNGLIAFARVYNRALNQLEIQNHFDQEKHLFGV